MERVSGYEPSIGREEQERREEEQKRKEQLARKFFEIAESAGLILDRRASAMSRGEITSPEVGAEIARTVWRRACDALGIDDDTRRRILDLAGQEGRGIMADPDRREG